MKVVLVIKVLMAVLFQIKILKEGEIKNNKNSVLRNKHQNIIQPFEKLALWSINDLSSL